MYSIKSRSSTRQVRQRRGLTRSQLSARPSGPRSILRGSSWPNSAAISAGV